jgi:hypothetical protein
MQQFSNEFNKFKFFNVRIRPMLEAEEANITLGAESFSTMVVPVLILNGLVENFVDFNETVIVKDYLIDGYGISEEHFDLLSNLRSLVFYGSEWKEFQDEIAQHIGSYLPWHLIAELNTDCTIGFARDYNSNKLTTTLFNNKVKRTYKLAFEMGDFNTMYEAAKIYISQNPNLDKL